MTGHHLIHLMIHPVSSQEKIDKYEERRQKCLKKVKVRTPSSKIVACNKLGIVYDASVGRHGVAREQIHTGDIVLVDLPTACSVG